MATEVFNLCVAGVAISHDNSTSSPGGLADAGDVSLR